MKNDTWSDVKNILCIRLDYMGDVLMCTPAIRAVKESYPACTVTLITSKSGAAIVPFIPEIDATIEYAAPWMKSSRAHSVDEDQQFVEALKGHNFDAAIIFTTYSQSALPAALLCYLAGIPLRLAYCRENPYQMLTDWVAETEPEQGIRHEVRRQLDMVATIGAYTDNEKLSFNVADNDLQQARQYLRRYDVDPAMPWVLIHPGATAASRRYPVEHWVEVIHQISHVLSYPVVMTGGRDEVDLVNAILNMVDANVSVVSLAGELTLGTLGALISLAPVMISNNTGPAHIAAATGTPLVVLYALTNPQHTPWQVRSSVLFQDVPCRFCYKSVCPKSHHDCLNKVAPSQVVSAMRVMLETDDFFQPINRLVVACGL